MAPCFEYGKPLESMDRMERFGARNVVREDSVLVVRVELVYSEPEIWRRLEIRGSLALGGVHQVLQAASAGRTRTCTGSHRMIRSRHCGRLTVRFRRFCSGFRGGV